MKNYFFFLFSIAFFAIIMAKIVGCKVEKQGHFIAVELQNSTIGEILYLQKYTGNTLITQDSVSSLTANKTIFKGNLPLKPGMYAISFKQKTLVNFFISDAKNQQFTIRLDINNPFPTLIFEDSPENYAFAGYLRFMEAKQKQQPTSQIQNEIRNNQDMLEKKFPGTMLALFVQSIREPKIPESNIPMMVTNLEQATQEYYYRYMLIHFFDNLDFSDKRILNMPILEQKLDYYFRQMVSTQPDSLIVSIENVLGRAKTDDEVYNWTVLYLYKMFREAPIQGNTEVYNFIGENYIISEPDRWNDLALVEKVSERVSKAKLNPIGSLATNLKLQTPDSKIQDLYRVKAPLTILYFFNPGCDACKPITETLFKLYNEHQRKGILVFAVYMDQQKEVWKQYISIKKLNWINVYDPDGSAGIEQKYDINAIPMIYLLDKNKKVIAKDIPVGELERYLSIP